MHNLTPLEAAEIIEGGICGQLGYDAAYIATVYLRAIAAGEYKQVVHAQWINFVGDFSTAECNKCGEVYEVSPDEEPCEDYFNAFKKFYKFCPSCGALMDGGKNNG